VNFEKDENSVFDKIAKKIYIGYNVECYAVSKRKAFLKIHNV
jgi:hypothetical protein